LTSEPLFERIVFIELPGQEPPVPAGLFTLDTDSGVGRFAYGRRYLQRPEALALDPVNLPLSAKEYRTRKNQGIFGVLGDLLPDSWGKYLLAKRLDIPFGSLAPHEMFAYVSSNAVGAISLGLSPEQPTSKKEAPISFRDLQPVAEVFARALANEALPAEVNYLLEQGTSLGGAQPKCPVIYENAEWIAKFANSKTPIKFPRLEFAAMRLARQAGITVPETRLEELAGQTVYLIKRFDRIGHQRLPFLSGHALANLDLEELEKGSYPELAGQMRKFVKNVNRDLHELYRRLVFNVFIRNQDDHLRNHGFIHGAQGWRLSPLYDVLPIPARRSADNFSLSLIIGQEGTTATIANLYSRHQSFNLSRAQAEQVVAEVAAATAGWEETLRECGVEPADIEAVRWSFSGFRALSGYGG